MPSTLATERAVGRRMVRSLKDFIPTAYWIDAMIVQEYTFVSMKRDMDLIRDLLLAIEEDNRLDGRNGMVPDETDSLGVIGTSGHSNEDVAYHLRQLIEAGFVKGKIGLDAMPVINGLTWSGHEFLDSIKSQSIWEKTKERVKDLPGVTLGVIAAIAEAELKKHLGLP